MEELEKRRISSKQKEYEKAFSTIDKVAVTTKDEKYQVYLPVILDSWLGTIATNRKDEDAIKKIAKVRNSKNDMIELYWESKKNKTAYLQYILANNKKMN